jgi:hypothetical protein
MSKDSPTPEDNLAQNLLDILNEAGITLAQQSKIMIKLVPYLVDRDHKILVHGIELAGRAHGRR